MTNAAEQSVTRMAEQGHAGALPYKIAVLCYLYDEAGCLLMLHRRKQPNAGMYSPIGGKLDLHTGEGPHECAVREIHEEAGLRIPIEAIRLTGIVSERAYEQQTHWLIFLYEVTRPVRRADIKVMNFDEGALEWVHVNDIEKLNIPETDRKFMWPLVKEHRGGFFMVHIDCSVNPMTWRVVESVKPTAGK
ncbi:MAG TPA: NUDIX domain-containing protein [Phycisphaerales bacterium]|nr:NUDIX domain-containing protein [Phycisphaerales bacterium]